MYWKHHEIIGVVCQGGLGLGNYNDTRWSKTNAKGRRGLMVQRVRAAVDEVKPCKSGMALLPGTVYTEGPGTRAIAFLQGTLRYRSGKLTFLLRAVADLFPTPNNLKIWGKEEDPSCKQCRSTLCTLNHILTGCLWRRPIPVEARQGP